jgi:hypothetical protein
VTRLGSGDGPCAAALPELADKGVLMTARLSRVIIRRPGLGRAIQKLSSPRVPPRVTNSCERPREWEAAYTRLKFIVEIYWAGPSPRPRPRDFRN